MQLLPFVISFVISSAFAALIPTIPKFAPCGTDIEGVCSKGTYCSPGSPSLCIPDSLKNSTTKVVFGYGAPRKPQPAPGDVASADYDVVPVWLGCEHSGFGGSCIRVSATCDECGAVPYGAGGPWDNMLSSIQLLSEDIVGCVFWTEPECWGYGLVLERGGIDNLNTGDGRFNDVISGWNCFLH